MVSQVELYLDQQPFKQISALESERPGDERGGI